MALAMVDETFCNALLALLGNAAILHHQGYIEDHVQTYHTTVFVGSVLPMSVYAQLCMLAATAGVVASDTG